MLNLLNILFCRLWTHEHSPDDLAQQSKETHKKRKNQAYLPRDIDRCQAHLVKVADTINLERIFLRRYY